MKHLLTLSCTLLLCSCQSASTPADPGSAHRSPEAYRIEQDSGAAMQDLYKKSADARRLGQTAVAILVFPEVTKAGFIVGAQGGKGALFTRDGGNAGYFNTVSASYGLQAGIQKFGYALFIMDETALYKLRQANGWEVGASPNLVVVDIGAAARMISTTTTTRGVYAFFFNQKGLMAGLSLEGSKISRIYP